MQNHRKIFFIALALLFLTLPAHAADDSWLGVGFNASVGGSFWHPVVESVSISKTYIGSPAFKAGLIQGDRVAEINGTEVKGANARDLKKMLHVPVGTVIRFKVIHPNGETAIIDVTTGAKPK